MILANVFSCYSKLHYLRCHIIIAADMQKNLRKIELAKKKRKRKRKPYLDVFSPLFTANRCFLDHSVFSEGDKNQIVSEGGANLAGGVVSNLPLCDIKRRFLKKSLRVDGCLSFLGGRFTDGIKTLIAVVNGQLI